MRDGVFGVCGGTLAWLRLGNDQLMPKVVVYIKVDDARAIEATEGRTIEAWVRTTLREQISHWHARKSGAMSRQRMPEAWVARQEQLKEGLED